MARTHELSRIERPRTPAAQALGWFAALAIFTLALAGITPARGAGTLTPVQAGERPIQILDHQVHVTINNGFAMTEVIQTFFNPNDRDLEALYSFPLPRSASLSEVTIVSGETEIHGEVLPNEQAQQVYEEEKSRGNDAGLAQKDEFYTFDFWVNPVRAQAETRLRFLYYQPLEIELGVGRYLYPLEEGGTDEEAQSFWTRNDRVEGSISIDVEVMSAWPITGVRTPGFESCSVVEQKDDGRHVIHIEKTGATLNRDFVLYYRLEENLPGRVELIPYRPDENRPGTFMMVVTPGMDLKPLDNGADYVFVLDCSGSMKAKIHTLAEGVSQVLGELKPHDRLRVVTFRDTAEDISLGWLPATRENVLGAVRAVKSLQAGGSTNLYDGINLALRSIDDDRATSIVLVTDGVTNTGLIDPAAFNDLMEQYDVRVFGFLMGNSANWPLMRAICEASGGFYQSVSNSDDIIGQILLAKEKVAFECLHAAELKIAGVEVFDMTNTHFGKIYRGQQLVFFGRYQKGGEARITLKGRLTGQDRVYTTGFDFPDIDESYPEIERLWALDQIEHLETQADIGAMEIHESEDAVRDLGVHYQLVTDETSMVVLADEAFAERGIERKNKQRVAAEEQARSARRQHAGTSGRAAPNQRADRSDPMFDRPAPSSGGGACDPLSIGMALGLIALGAGSLRGRRSKRTDQHDNSEDHDE